jgi:hypothetical protein
MVLKSSGSATATPLRTGTKLMVGSINGRVMRAIPTLAADIYVLAWKPRTSDEGRDAAVTFIL